MTSLKFIATATALAAAALAPQAQAQNYQGNQEMGRVISSVPVMQQVAVPRQVCNMEQVVVPGQRSGAGALLGGVAGGAVGNAIGGGSGRAAATVLGVVGGAILGNNIEGGGQPETRNVQRCYTQTSYENQAIGYNVTYEYGGKQYTVQMQQDPGQWVRLQVTPAQQPYSQPYGQPYYPPQSQVMPMRGYEPTTVFNHETTYIVPAPIYPRGVNRSYPVTQVYLDSTPQPPHYRHNDRFVEKYPDRRGIGHVHPVLPTHGDHDRWR